MLKSINSEVIANSSNIKNLKQFKYDIKYGESITIPTTHLSNGSHTKVDVVCDVCKKDKFIEYRYYIQSIKNGGYYSCSQKCSKDKAIKTNIERYGVDNPAKSEKIKNKIKKTFLDKYGVENISFLPEIVERIKNSNKKTYKDNYDVIKSKTEATNIERYGVADVNKEEWFKEKIKQSNIEKYGVDSPSKLDSVKEKIKKTNIERYGVGSPSKLDSVKEKIKKTNIERYGVEYPSKLDSVKEKMKKTNIERYGVENPSQCPEIYEKAILSGYKIKEFNGILYQGSYELEFIIFCNNNDIKISKPKSIKYEIDGEIKRYYPDFFIDKYNLIVEIKSTYYNNLHYDKNISKKMLLLIVVLNI